MPPAGFEQVIPAIKRFQNYDLDHAAIWIVQHTRTNIIACQVEKE
jgi:hypothetical protein